MTGHSLAIALLNPARIRSIEESIRTAFNRRRTLSGSDISASISPGDPGEGARILEILYAEGVLTPLKRSQAIQGTLFGLESARATDYFEQEATAAKIAMEMGLSVQRERNSDTIEIVATLPPGTSKSIRRGRIDSTDGAIKSLIVSSEHTVWIACPYFDEVGNDTIRGALMGRARDRIMIRILSRQIGGCGEGMGSRSRRAIDRLADDLRSEGLEGQLEVRDLFHRDRRTGELLYALHSKVVISDSRGCYIGSANVTRGSLGSNFELGVVLKGEPVMTVLSLVEEMWSMASPVQHGSAARRHSSQ